MIAGHVWDDLVIRWVRGDRRVGVAGEATGDESKASRLVSDGRGSRSKRLALEPESPGQQLLFRDVQAQPLEAAVQIVVHPASASRHEVINTGDS